MFLQFFTLHKGAVKFIHHIFFTFGKFIRIFLVNRRKIDIFHFINIFTDSYRTVFKVNFIKQAPFVHIKFWVILYKLSLKFELNNGNRLVHFHFKFYFRFVWVLFIFNFKTTAVIICIHAHSKRCKRYHINSVTILDNVKIAVSDTVSDNGCNASRIADSRPHPKNIVVAPLNIKWMIRAKLIHYLVCSAAPVVYIAYYVQMVNDKSLYKLRYCDNKLFRRTNFKNCIHYSVIIRTAI